MFLDIMEPKTEKNANLEKKTVLIMWASPIHK